MKNVSINLYSFQELTEKAKQFAIMEHRTFLLSVLQPDYIDGVPDWDDPEKMEMYRDEYSDIDENDEPVIESIEINDYLFYYDGKMCNACTYTAGPNKGLTEIKIHGETYYINGEVKENEQL